MTAKAPNRRKTLVVLPEMQREIVRRSMLMPGAALLVLGLAATWLCLQILGEAAARAVELPGLRLLLPSILCTVLVMAALLYRQARHLSNKLGGPAYSIAKHLREVRENHGSTPRELRLRKGDYLEELRDEVNRFVE